MIPGASSRTGLLDTLSRQANMSSLPALQSLYVGKVCPLAFTQLRGRPLAVHYYQTKRQVVCRGLPGFGSSEMPKATSKEWMIPTQLLPCTAPAASVQESQEEGTSGSGSSRSNANSTVYTIRLKTSFERSSALSEPMAGVNVCLIAKDGRAVLHRIAPVNDPMDNFKVMESICSLVGEESGADCKSLSSMDTPNWPTGKEPRPKARFQEGAVDEVSFIAPELGSLAAILVAPEGGSWVCDEVDVFSSRTKHMDRFVCRKRLGGRKGDPAAYLTPVPPNAVVYGTGDAARIITKEQAAALQAMSMSDYSSLKSQLLLITALLTLGGSGVAVLASGMDAAVPFAIGGIAGLAYQLLLQLGADAAVAGAAARLDATATAAAASQSQAPAPAKASTPGQHSFQGRMLNLLGSSAVRLALLTSAAVVAVWALQDGNGTTDDATEAVLFRLTPVDAWQLGLGLCGFMMYKVAVLGVSLVPVQAGRELEPAQKLGKNV